MKTYCKLSFAILLILCLATSRHAHCEEVSKKDLETYEKALYVGDKSVREAAAKAIVRHHPNAFELLIPYLEKYLAQKEAVQVTDAMSRLQLGEQNITALEKLYKFTSESQLKDFEKLDRQYNIAKLMFNIAPDKYAQQFFDLIVNRIGRNNRASSQKLDLMATMKYLPTEKIYTVIPVLLDKIMSPTISMDREDYIEMVVNITGKNLFSSKSRTPFPNNLELLDEVMAYKKLYEQTMTKNSP